MRSHTILRVLVALIALLAASCSGGDEMQTFVPATYAERGRIVMPVTFPDGTTAELLYPSALELARFAIRPYSSGRLQGKSRSPGRSDIVARDFVIEDADVEDVLARRSTGPPQLLDRYDGIGSLDVGLWALGRAGQNVHYLGFQFGRWAVLVYDYIAAGAMTDAERASWAANFSGRKAPDGLLVLEGSGPLRLARAGDHAGPQLLFSAGPGRSLQLYPGRCSPHRDQTLLVAGKLVSWSRGFANWCLSDSMRIHAEGNREFVGALIGGLAVRNVAVATG